MAGLSSRASKISNYPNILTVALVKQQADAFDKVKNPEGIINLGTSENKLMFDILIQKECPAIQVEDTTYSDFSGEPSFKKAIAKFLEYYMKPVKPIVPNNLIVFNGCAAVLEALGTLLADQGGINIEGFLAPAPYYGSFNTHLGQRAGIVLLPITMSSTPLPGEDGPFELSIARLEDAYEKATNKGVTIRAILLSNPHNPLGNIFSEKSVRDCLHFAHKHSIHVIMDEIYMLSIYREGSTMHCALSLDNIPDPEKLHVMWGFSKDFCVSGFRCGAVYTSNKDLAHAMKQMSLFQSASRHTQGVPSNDPKHLCETELAKYPYSFLKWEIGYLCSLEWLDHVYIPTNHKRLRECFNLACDVLKELDVPYVEPKAGFFIWADFRKFLSSATLEEEWKLFEEFNSCKVYISPGQAFFGGEPGWFRIIFATEPVLLKKGLERLRLCIKMRRPEPLPNGY